MTAGYGYYRTNKFAHLVILMTNYGPDRGGFQAGLVFNGTLTRGIMGLI